MTKRFPHLKVRPLFLLVLAAGSLLFSGCGEKEMIEAKLKVEEEKIITPPYLPTDFASFRNFSVNNGLPENTVNSMAIDEQGFLWVSTQSGLAKFENNGFHSYHYSENNPNSVFPKWSLVYSDYQNRICAHNAFGVTIYDPVGDKFRRVENPVGDSTILQDCYLDAKENLWVIRPSADGRILEMYQHTTRKVQEDYPRARNAHFVQTNDGTLYCMMDFDHRREIIHLSGGNKGINTTALVIDGSYQLGKTNPYFFGMDEMLLGEDEFIAWVGENNFFKIDGSKTEEWDLLPDSGRSIVNVKFYENLQKNDQYMIAQYEDVSFELFRFNSTADSLTSCLVFDGVAINAAVNSQGDVSMITYSENTSEYPHPLINYVLMEDTTYFIPSNLQSLDGVLSVSAIYDKMDNLWLGTQNRGVNVFSPVDQAFRKNDLGFMSEEEAGTLYYPIYSSGDTTVIISRKGKIFPGLGRSPIQLKGRSEIKVIGYRKHGNKILISTGLPGCFLYDVSRNSVDHIDINQMTGDRYELRTGNARIDSKGRFWGYGRRGIYQISHRNGGWDRSTIKIYQHSRDPKKRNSLMDHRIEDIMEVGGKLYLTAQMPEQLLVYNEESDSFEVAKTDKPIWGRRWFTIEEQLWLTSFFSGFIQVDTSTMTPAAKFSRQNDALPESWIRTHTLLGSDKILWRGEPKKWYTFNHRTGENHQLNQYEEFDYFLTNMSPVYNQNSYQLLPGTDCIYEYDINYIDEMERNRIILDRLLINKKDVSSRLPEKLSSLESIELPHDENNLQIVFKDLVPQERNHLFYEFTLEGRDTKWRSNEDLKVSYPELAPGEYTFKARLTSKLNGESSQPIGLKIKIRNPFYLTGGALALYFFGFIFSIFSVTRARTRKLRKKQIELEKVIAEKTHDITLQKEDLEEKQREILDSIAYAKRIQSAILPQDDQWKKYLPQSFVLYLPKDIVAGDFYWLHHEGDRKIYFAAADCTGHGVPGAMVSVVCNNSLNKAVSEYGLTKPGEILDKTREIVVAEFEKSAEGVKDGMDIALCCLTVVDEEGKESQVRPRPVQNDSAESDSIAPLPSASEITIQYKLEYAGAHNPLWIVRNGATEVEEIKGDKQPIGVHITTDPFTNHELEINSGDTLYIFSDGFADQFGGEKGKKFKAANFKKLLLAINNEPIETQQEILMNSINEWRGDLEQLDDICVIGVRF